MMTNHSENISYSLNARFPTPGSTHKTEKAITNI